MRYSESSKAKMVRRTLPPEAMSAVVLSHPPGPRTVAEEAASDRAPVATAGCLPPEHMPVRRAAELRRAEAYASWATIASVSTSL